MNNAPIAYTPSAVDRAYISETFGCDLDDIPVELTEGRVNDDGTGVLFGDSIRGYRIELPLEGRSVLAAIARSRTSKIAA